MISKTILLMIVLAPLVGAAIAGLLGRQVGRVGAHVVTIAGVGLSCVLSFYVLQQLVWGGAAAFNENVYTWMEIGRFNAHIGFLVDRLTAMMMVVVTFVSLMVHIYSIGYMREDPGYQKFFSYIALFTFSMLALVMSNNFLQLFFGWEAVGLVSYLLIGFWFKRPSAVSANLKAFLVNRVGDFGFLLGIAGVLFWFGSLDYYTVFGAAQAPHLDLGNRTVELIAGHPWHVATIVSLCLFVGAMGKSAQVPLHVWLPDSMEGPTPISALIHAATMVTAGIFMVARLSPIFELSGTALSVVLVIGATTALFTGLIGIVQNDIKRVVAYSTLSQLGYMTVALGVSAYAGGVYHLMTHAFFKALLFLGAGSVIIAMHHHQDMRYMGGLRKQMPITWITMWLGSLALAGMPGFSGFFSKDAIIEAVKLSDRGGAGYAYFCVLAGVFVTALYSFRLLYLTFHGKPRYNVDSRAGDDTPQRLPHAPTESPASITVPLVLLAIPSVLVGWFTIGPMLFGNFFRDSILVKRANNVLAEFGAGFDGPLGMTLHGLVAAPTILAVAGFAVATYIWLINPGIAARAARGMRPVYNMLVNKYWVDELYHALFARGSVRLGRAAWRGADAGLIDGLVVNGSVSLVAKSSALLRRLQTGYLYHYAFAMIVGLIVLLGGLWWTVARTAI